jgi:hypothetical protein
VLLPSELEELPACFFAYCGNLRSINLHACERLRAIGANCFMQCFSLRRLTFLPQSLVRIGREAFKESGVEVVDLSRAMRMDGVGLEGAAWLTDVRLPFRGTYLPPSIKEVPRLADLTAGDWRPPRGGTWDLPRLGRFRLAAMRVVSEDPVAVAYVRAMVSGETANPGKRHCFPSMPL